MCVIDPGYLSLQLHRYMPVMCVLAVTFLGIIATRSILRYADGLAYTRLLVQSRLISPWGWYMVGISRSAS